MTSVRVKTAKKRSNSSARWLQQLNDPYVVEANRLGIAHGLLSRSSNWMTVSATGPVRLWSISGGTGWLVSGRGETGCKGRGRILALDILEMDPIVDVDVMQGDFLSEEVYEALLERVREAGGRGVDVVLSDMAAPTTGHGPTDHLRTIALCEAAWEFAEKVLAPGGTFVAKVFKGGGERSFWRPSNGRSRRCGTRSRRQAGRLGGTYVVAPD